MVRLVRAPWSTNVERVALALAHKGVEVESVVIDYSDRTKAIELSGQGLVPVLDDDGTVVADSRRILRHLEATRPDPPLFPSDPCRRAGLEVFMEWFDEVWKGPPNAIADALDAGTADHDEIARHAARMDAWQDVFEDFLARPRLPARRVLRRRLPGLPVPEVRRASPSRPTTRPSTTCSIEHLTVEGRPNLAAWIERMDARPQV